MTGKEAALEALRSALGACTEEGVFEDMVNEGLDPEIINKFCDEVFPPYEEYEDPDAPDLVVP